MSRIIPFGIIGMGNQGSVYAKLLTTPRENQHYSLAAMSSRNEAKREQYAALYPDVAFFTDWKEMVCSGAVEAVIVVTPHKTHTEVTKYCLEHGVHVLLDKPAGLHGADVATMNACAEAHPELAFGMIFNQRSNALYQRAREVVQSGELGNLRRTLWTTTDCWRPDCYYDQSPWCGTWGGEGGGVLMNQAIHQLDLWQWICGMPEKLYATAQFGLHRNVAVENDVTILAQYPNGVTGTFITCSHDPLGVDRLELSFDNGKIVIEGTGKTGQLYRMNITEAEMNKDMPMDKVLDFMRGKPLPGMYTVEQLTCAELWGQQHGTIIENFSQHVAEGTPLLVPGVEGLNSLQLANAAVLSAWTSKEVTFPLDGEAYLAALNEAVAKEGIYPPL